MSLSLVVSEKNVTLIVMVRMPLYRQQTITIGVLQLALPSVIAFGTVHFPIGGQSAIAKHSSYGYFTYIHWSGFVGKMQSNL